jgi:serine protease inhibitor ecotin
MYWCLDTAQPLQKIIKYDRTEEPLFHTVIAASQRNSETASPERNKQKR